VLVHEAEGDRAYVLEFGADAIAVVDPEDGLVVDRFHVGDGPSAAVYDPDQHRLYVSLFKEGSVAVVDLDPASPRYRTTVAKIAGD
jgi:DNA-binding beta-propeller fold protein YncE